MIMDRVEGRGAGMGDGKKGGVQKSVAIENKQFYYHRHQKRSNGYARLMDSPQPKSDEEKNIFRIEALPPSPHTVIQLFWSNIKLLHKDGQSLRGWLVHTPLLNTSNSARPKPKLMQCSRCSKNNDNSVIRT